MKNAMSSSKTKQVDWEKKYRELEKKVKSSNDDGDSEDLYISPDRPVRVMNLCPGILNLASGPKREDKHRRFTEFGQIKTIPYSILQEMMEWQPTFFESGRAYILDKNIIRKAGLEDAYSNILGKDDIEKILMNSDGALRLYKTLNDRQKETVNEMLIEKVYSGEINDLTFIYSIQKEGNVDILGKVKRLEESNK